VRQNGGAVKVPDRAHVVPIDYFVGENGDDRGGECHPVRRRVLRSENNLYRISHDEDCGGQDEDARKGRYDVFGVTVSVGMFFVGRFGRHP